MKSNNNTQNSYQIMRESSSNCKMLMMYLKILIIKNSSQKILEVTQVNLQNKRKFEISLLSCNANAVNALKMLFFKSVSIPSAVIV